MNDTIEMRARSRMLRRTGLALALLSLAGGAQAATCLAYNPANKANKLYLLYPNAPLTYPSFGFSAGSVTNPAAAFNAADLPSYTGTTTALRDAITHVVELDYCEFNVQVIPTATLPPATFPRRNTVAVTTKSDITDGLFGLAQNVDTGDGTAVVGQGAACAVRQRRAVDRPGETLVDQVRQVAGMVNVRMGKNDMG